MTAPDRSQITKNSLPCGGRPHMPPVFWTALDLKIPVLEHGPKDGADDLVDGEWQRDMRAVGVPLVSSDGNTVMSRNCTGSTLHLNREILEQDLGPRLSHLSRGIAPMLGGS